MATPEEDRKLDCLFVSDLHGKEQKYSSLFNLISEEEPDMVFNGGDILPNSHKARKGAEAFLEEDIFGRIKELREQGIKTKFIFIMGNDDPRFFEPLLVKADEDGIISYVNQKALKFNDLYVAGYSFVPPSPFQLKDWEKYDVSRFVDVGTVPPEEGTRSYKVSKRDMQFSTIIDDLGKLSEASPPEKTIYLFHSPPYNSYLDRAALDGIMVEHAPVDVHVGSIAIQRFIENEQPLLTLHGHIHESARLTGQWREIKGRTHSFSASHDGPELALVRFDTEDLANATRELISLD